MTGKALGEEGFLELAGALIKALEHEGEHGRVLYLEELSLKTNKLNASCLPALARIVRLAAFELRDLDLSDNHITIPTGQDAEAWQDFLESFGDCRMLRRVDLTGNTLAPKAFEVLARVYSKEPPVDHLTEDDIEIVLLDGTPNRRSTSGDTEALNRQARDLSLGSASEPYSEDDEPAPVTSYQPTHGNRHGWSIPCSCLRQG